MSSSLSDWADRISDGNKLVWTLVRIGVAVVMAIVTAIGFVLKAETQ